MKRTGNTSSFSGIVMPGIYDVECSNDSIHAKLDPQIGYHNKYLTPKVKKLNEFDKRHEPEVVNTVHLYTSDPNFNFFDTLISLPLSNVDSIASYSYAPKPSRTSVIVPIIFAPFLGIAVIVIMSSLNGGLYSLDQ